MPHCLLASEAERPNRPLSQNLPFNELAEVTVRYIGQSHHMSQMTWRRDNPGKFHEMASRPPARIERSLASRYVLRGIASAACQHFDPRGHWLDRPAINVALESIGMQNLTTLTVAGWASKRMRCSSDS